MMQLKTNLVLFVTLLLVQMSFGQGIIDKINQSFDDAVNDLTEKSMEKVTDQLIQKILNGESVENDSTVITQSGSDTSSVKNEELDLSSIFGTKKLEGTYQLDYQLDYEIRSGDNINYMTMYIPENGGYVFSNMSGVEMLMDFQSGKTYSIVNGKAYSFGSKTFEEYMEAPYHNDENAKVEKTNQFKTIAGYKCQLFIITTKEGVSNLWVTFDLTQMYQVIDGELAKQLQEMSGGYPLLVEFTDTKGDLLIQEVKQVQKVDKLVDLSQY